MATIAWTEEAQRWLEDIFEYIAADRGKTIMQPVEIPLGDAKRPVPPSQVVEKYVRNAGEVVGPDVARQTAQMLLEIETLASIRPVLDRLAKRS